MKNKIFFGLVVVVVVATAATAVVKACCEWTRAPVAPPKKGKKILTVLVIKAT